MRLVVFACPTGIPFTKNSRSARVTASPAMPAMILTKVTPAG
jgi:hypothetical protein